MQAAPRPRPNGCSPHGVAQSFGGVRAARAEGHAPSCSGSAPCSGTHSRQAPKMAQARRQLGLFDATMIVMGGIVGAGIFANPSEVAHRVHTPFLILGVWMLGGLIAMCGAFIWAELATRLPAAEGGQYVYLREAYDPAVAFMYGWGLLLVTQTGGMAAVAVIFASYFRALTGVNWNDSVIAAIALLALTGINCLGARAGSNVQSALMLLKIGAIAALVVIGFAVGHPSAAGLKSGDLLGQPASFGLL